MLTETTTRSVCDFTRVCRVMDEARSLCHSSAYDRFLSGNGTFMPLMSIITKCLETPRREESKTVKNLRRDPFYVHSQASEPEATDCSIQLYDTHTVVCFDPSCT